MSADKLDEIAARLERGLSFKPNPGGIVYQRIRAALAEAVAPCKCRNARHNRDSRWEDCGEWTRERLLAALAAREAKP